MSRSSLLALARIHWSYGDRDRFRLHLELAKHSPADVQYTARRLAYAERYWRITDVVVRGEERR